MDLKALLDYLPQLKFSSSRTISCMLLKKKDFGFHASSYEKLFNHLRSTEKSGVVQVSPAEFGSVAPFFKEVYVFPIAAIDPDPSFLEDAGYDRYLLPPSFPPLSPFSFHLRTQLTAISGN